MDRKLLVALSLVCGLTVSGSTAETEELPGPAHQQTDTLVGSASEPVVSSKAPAISNAQTAPKASTPSLVPDFINFGYMQFDPIPSIRWHSLTHVGTPFIDFLADGSINNPSTFTSRHSDLRPGGAAQAAGTKVIMVVRNQGFNDALLASCMQSASARTALVNNVKNLVLADSYCAGVNFDFEFSWNSTTRDGITAFMQAMRAALPNHELSVYTHASYSATQWNVAALEPTIDYMIYSTYDWGTSRAHAISDFNNCVGQLTNYFNAGLPPHKMVLAWASYGRRWEGATGYDQSGTGVKVSHGFADGLYETTLRPTNGGPFTSNYVTGDEAEWYTYNMGGVNYTTTWDSPASLEMKIRAALSMPPGGSGTTHRGKRLRGVAWWSLGWFTNYAPPTFTARSYNPIANAVQTRARTYPHVYQMVEEFLSKPGDKQFLFEGFENLNPRWTDPNESPDTDGDTDNDSAVALVNKPAGGPANSSKAARVYFDFEASSNNRLFFRHEVLNDETDTAVVDVHSAVVHVDSTTAFRAQYYVAGNYSARTIRMALLDGNRQIEVSPAVALPSSSGWNELVWDITDSTKIQAYNTDEPAYLDGNGTLNTAGNGARDIRFLGFIIQGGGSGSGFITFDELSYEHRNPGGKQYTINEFRYSTAGEEFVEIKGPAGAFPANLQLRFYNSSNGSVASSVNLGGQSVPASGLFVVGDSGVPGTTGGNGMVPGGWGAADNIPNTDPSAIQLYDTTTGAIYDSVTYEAMGGLDQLARQSAKEVTGEGYAWLGEIGPGTTTGGQGYTHGRFPDGADTQVNQNDFSMMPPTPGASNGNSVALGTTFNFESPHSGVYQSYQSPSFVNPASHSVPASPNGGNVWRVVDTTGGGVVGGIGDASLGATEGYSVTGQIYIPASGATAQALGVGIAGRQGSTFFPFTYDSSGYESGYWLIYEQGANALADGQPDHPGAFQFVHATNDNMDPVPTTALGSNRTLAQLGVTAGTWSTFKLTVDPAAATDKLVAQVNGQDVYRGAIPAGGPTSGAFQAGFRDAGGGLTASEGTFLDNIKIESSNPPQPPAAPTNLNANPSLTNIALTWTDNATNETAYVVERKRDDEGTFSQLTTLGANATSYTDNTAVADHEYCYQVRATNNDGSAVSNSDCASLQEPPTPAAPTALGATTSGPMVMLNWTDNSDNEDGFAIERKRDDELTFSALTTVGPGTTQYTDEDGLVRSRQYCYRVRAFNVNGSSEFSNVECVTIPAEDTKEHVANPGGSGDLFGYSIAKFVAGKQVGFIVGAPGADSGVTSDTGRAYLFYPPSTTPTLVLENPATESVYGNFGFSVGAIGNSVVVGAPGPETAFGNGGRVYMFDAATGDLQRTVSATTPLPGERFGHAVSAIGKTDLVIGAPSPLLGGGRTYIYNLKKQTTVTLESASAAPGTQFGYAVAGGKGKLGVVSLGGDCSRGHVDIFTKKGALYAGLDEAFSIASVNGKFLVGAPLHLDCTDSKAGWAYLMAGKLPGIFYANPQAALDDAFGYSVAGGKKFVGVGAALFDETGAQDAGRAYLYRVKSTLPADSFANPQPAAGDHFGHSMAIAEGMKLPTKQKLSMIAIGAPYSDENGLDGGAVYFFEIPLK